MNILIIYPKYTNGSFGLEYIMKFLGLVDGFPPPILLKISSMLPKVWNKRMIDMNGSELKDDDIHWADYVFIRAKLTQAKSANKIIERCKILNAKTIAYGSLFTSNDEYYKNIDHLVFDEVEITLPQFLRDLSEGKTKQIYTSKSCSNYTPAY
ncbi:MAG: hypothetical protein EHM44_05280 [Ignavibacteriales bacterium]|nr:MAG: hypothetical protein EHM44_05280 [Ignavibacteriales bacterium]